MSETGTLTAIEAMGLALDEVDDAIHTKSAEVADLRCAYEQALGELRDLENDFAALEEGLRVMEERSAA